MYLALCVLQPLYLVLNLDALCTMYCMQEFEGADGTDDDAVIKNPESAKLVDTILGLESYEDLSFALTTLRTETRGVLILQAAIF